MPNRITDRRKFAFTLTEIMVVLVIFAVIAGFALPGFEKTIMKSRERTAILSLTSISAANDIYMAKFNEYYQGNLGNVNQINNALKIGIKDQDMTYSYASTSTVAYTASAAWTGNGPFTARVDERPIALANNPCCSSAAGTCPSLPACP